MLHKIMYDFFEMKELADLPIKWKTNTTLCEQFENPIEKSLKRGQIDIPNKQGNDHSLSWLRTSTSKYFFSFSEWRLHKFLSSLGIWCQFLEYQEKPTDRLKTLRQMLGFCTLYLRHVRNYFILLKVLTIFKIFMIMSGRTLITVFYSEWYLTFIKKNQVINAKCIDGFINVLCLPSKSIWRLLSPQIF